MADKTPQTVLQPTTAPNGTAFRRVAFYVIRTALGSYYATAGQAGQYEATRVDSMHDGTYAPPSRVDFRAIPHIVESIPTGRVLKVRSA